MNEFFSHILAIQIHWKVKLLSIFLRGKLGISTCGAPESRFNPQPDGKFGFLFLFFLSSIVACRSALDPHQQAWLPEQFRHQLESTDDDKQCDKLELVVESTSNLHLLWVSGCWLLCFVLGFSHSNSSFFSFLFFFFNRHWKCLLFCVLLISL